MCFLQVSDKGVCTGFAAWTKKIWRATEQAATPDFYFVILEVNLRSKLELTHVWLTTTKDSIVDAGDKTGITCGAVNAT
jgi:hypothetical protein